MEGRALVETEEQVGAEGRLQLHVALGREPVRRPIQPGPEDGAVLVHLDRLQWVRVRVRRQPAAAFELVGDLAVAEAEDLEAARVGGRHALPAHEPVQPARRRHGGRAWLHGQVIRVADQGLDPRPPRRLEVESLEGRPGGDREEARRLQAAVGGFDHAPAGVAVAGQDLKPQHPDILG